MKIKMLNIYEFFTLRNLIKTKIIKRYSVLDLIIDISLYIFIFLNIVFFKILDKYIKISENDFIYIMILSNIYFSIGYMFYCLFYLLLRYYKTNITITVLKLINNFIIVDMPELNIPINQNPIVEEADEVLFTEIKEYTSDEDCFICKDSTLLVENSCLQCSFKCCKRCFFLLIKNKKIKCPQCSKKYDLTEFCKSKCYFDMYNIKLDNCKINILKFSNKQNYLYEFVGTLDDIPLVFTIKVDFDYKFISDFNISDLIFKREEIENSWILDNFEVVKVKDKFYIIFDNENYRNEIPKHEIVTIKVENNLFYVEYKDFNTGFKIKNLFRYKLDTEWYSNYNNCKFLSVINENQYRLCLDYFNFIK